MGLEVHTRGGFAYLLLPVPASSITDVVAWKRVKCDGVMVFS